MSALKKNLYPDTGAANNKDCKRLRNSRTTQSLVSRIGFLRNQTSRKIWDLLTPGERKSALVLLGLMGVSMMLETLGIGLVIPVIALLVQDDLAASYPKAQPVLQMLGNPTQVQLVTGGMLALVGIYLLKNTTYLCQPYTFHLQRTSAQLIRNVTGEVGVFQTTLFQFMMLLTEVLVLVGITALLLTVEPVGALIVVVALGHAASAPSPRVRIPWC